MRGNPPSPQKAEKRGRKPPSGSVVSPLSCVPGTSEEIVASVRERCGRHCTERGDVLVAYEHILWNWDTSPPLFHGEDKTAILGEKVRVLGAQASNLPG